MPFVVALGDCCDDAMVVRWSANPLGMLWPEMDAAFRDLGRRGPAGASWRPLVVIPNA